MMQQLFNDHYALVRFWVRRYAHLVGRDAALDVDDLSQAGALGLMDAARTFDPECGRLSSWASIHVKGAILDALGMGTGSPMPLSLDAPAYDDESDETLLDVVADPEAVDALDALLDDELVDSVRKAVECLPEPLRTVTQRHDLEGVTWVQCGREMRVQAREARRLSGKALQALRKDRRIRALADFELETRYHAHKGVRAFNSTFSSVVEDAVISREARRKRAERGL
jgi:RNA polymerase sigma factor (sigma-70 family)